MTLLWPQSVARATRNAVLFLSVVMILCALSPRCHGQRISGAATITLTATLSQSLTMSVAPSTVKAASAPDFFSDRTTNPSELTINTNWVRGSGEVSVAAFSPANPILGVAGQALVPVGIGRPIAHDDDPVPVSPLGENFLSSAKSQSHSGIPGLRIDTRDLLIPDGSQGGVLTIRADAL